MNNFRFFLKKIIVLTIFFTFFSSANKLASEEPTKTGLPMFWWKEGNFVNFGDYLSYQIVQRIVGQPLPFYNKKSPNQSQKLLALGSIFYFANEGDIVWGSGINGKRLDKKDYSFVNLDIRAVRGPLTRNFLTENFGMSVPEVYGDPALLVPYLFPEFKRKANPSWDYVVIVHYLDIPYFLETDDPHIMFATQPWDIVLERILDSRFVISSSLHGIILAEAYGIPARYVRITENEPVFKFYDYYLGTGRASFEYASSIEEALKMGGEPGIVWDPEKLYRAFPIEFWPRSTLPLIPFK